MSQKRSNSSSGNEGCAIVLFSVLVWFAVASIIPSGDGVIILIACVIGALIGIGVAINNATKKKEEAKQKNLAIVNAAETRPELISIPSSTVFTNEEEEHINLSFREFLEKNNDFVLAQAHVEYLNNKANALRALGRTDEATQLDTELATARTELSVAQSKCGDTFESKYNNFLYRSTEIKNAYMAFASKLPNQRLSLIGDFFQSPQIKTVHLEGTTALLFTPAYVMHYSGPGQTIKLIQYKDIGVSSWITTEALRGQMKPNDEIEHIGYRHETKKGYPDMRYSYENNPARTFVYRGSVTIRCNGSWYEQEFSNKSLTEGFEKSLKDYLSLLMGKYSTVIHQILAHNEELIAAGNIDTFIAQQAAAEKERVAAEKAKREKQEKARLERQAKAKAKREKEQAEREAAAREKQREADFLRSLTIVDSTLTSWNGNDKNFVLPEGLAATIGTALRGKSKLESVELPNGITSIQANAFHGNTALRRIVIPKTVSEIGREAFLGCTLLNEISLPDGIKVITSQMFGKCSSLKSVKIPDGVRKIEKGAFSDCANLQELILPEGIAIIEDDVFENCVSLKKVVLPNSVIKIGENVFNGCAALEHVVFGSGLKRIPNACFNNQQKLLDVAVASDMVEIGDRAFQNCQMLSRIIFNETKDSAASKSQNFEALISSMPSAKTDMIALDSLERIGESAFENCFVFSGLDLRDGLRFIGDYAFANCRSIKTVNLPASINSFGKGVFSGCVDLSTVVGAENVDWHKKNSFIGTPWLSTQAEDGFVIFDGLLEAYTGSDSSVSIPQSVKAIGRSAFDGNTHISSVFIPEGVVSIDEFAFANCRKLKSIRIADSVTHIADNAFANNAGFVIQCSRGSSASSFRRRNRIAGEYIAKDKTAGSTKPSTRKSRNSIPNGLSGLSEEELRVIMEMRREKLAQKKAEEEKPVEPEKTEYVLVPFDESKVSIKLRNDNRKITNNIFHLWFVQSESASATKGNAEYETFVVDSYGKIISDIKTISADKSGDDLTHKVAYSLFAQEKFDKTSAYYVVLRYKGAGTSILSKTQYQINIEFASDFDF